MSSHPDREQPIRAKPLVQKHGQPSLVEIVLEIVDTVLQGMGEAKTNTIASARLTTGRA